MKQSFISAAVGWVVCMIAFALHFLRTVGRSSLAGMPALALFSGVVIFLVWSCLLWPLYVFVPPQSAWWRALPCVPAGALAGGVILLAFFMLISRSEPHPWRAIELPFLYIGPIVGAVTCGVGVALKSRENRA